MKDLAYEGSTMVVVTHEMQFARDVSDRGRLHGPMAALSSKVILKNCSGNQKKSARKHSWNACCLSCLSAFLIIFQDREQKGILSHVLRK